MGSSIFGRVSRRLDQTTGKRTTPIQRKLERWPSRRALAVKVRYLCGHSWRLLEKARSGGATGSQYPHRDRGANAGAFSCQLLPAGVVPPGWLGYAPKKGACCCPVLSLRPSIGHSETGGSGFIRITQCARRLVELCARIYSAVASLYSRSRPQVSPPAAPVAGDRRSACSWWVPFRDTIGLNCFHSNQVARVAFCSTISTSKPPVSRSSAAFFSAASRLSLFEMICPTPPSRAHAQSDHVWADARDGLARRPGPLRGPRMQP